MWPFPSSGVGFRFLETLPKSFFTPRKLQSHLKSANVPRDPSNGDTNTQTYKPAAPEAAKPLGHNTVAVRTYRCRAGQQLSPGESSEILEKIEFNKRKEKASK